MSLRDRLKRYDQPFRDAPNPDDRAKLPDGEYLATLHHWEVKTDREIPRLVLTFSCTEPDYDGRYIFVGHTLDPQHIGWLKGTLYALGMDPPPVPSEMIDHLRDYVGNSYLLALRTKGEYQNAYVRELVRRRGHVTSEQPAGPTGDDIPF